MLQHLIFWHLAYWLNKILAAPGNRKGHKHQSEMSITEDKCLQNVMSMDLENVTLF